MTGDDQWARALDHFEAGLRHHAAVLAGGESTGDSPWPPPALPTGEIPAHLQDRAFALFDESRALAGAVAERLAALEASRPTRRPARTTADHPRISMSL